MFRPFITYRKLSNRRNSNKKPGVKLTHSACPSCTKDWWPKKFQSDVNQNDPEAVTPLPHQGCFKLTILLLANCFQVLSSQLTPRSLLAPECSSKKQLVRDALKDPDKRQFSTLEKQLSRPGKANIRVIHILQPLHNHFQCLGMAISSKWVIQCI